MASMGSIVGGAFRLFRERPGAVAAWTLFYFAWSIATALAMSYLLTGTLSITPSPAPYMRPDGLAPGMWQVLILVYVGGLAVGTVLINAVFRAMLRPEERGFASLRLGIDELRMAGVILLVVLGSAVAFFIAQLLLMLVTTFIGMVAGNGGVTVALMFLLMLGFLAAMIWVQVRLSLIFPLTFYRRRISIDAAWDLTRGRFWTLFGAYLTAALAICVCWAALMWAMMGDYLAAMWAARGDPMQMQLAAMQFAQQQYEMPVTTRIVYMILGTLVFAIGLALGPGVIASATRELLIERGPGDEGEGGYDAPEAD